MKNTTKLKHILQLYIVTLDMDDDGQIVLTLRDKRTGSTETFVNRAYSTVIAKAFGYMNREMKFKLER